MKPEADILPANIKSMSTAKPNDEAWQMTWEEKTAAASSRSQLADVLLLQQLLLFGWQCLLIVVLAVRRHTWLQLHAKVRDVTIQRCRGLSLRCFLPSFNSHKREVSYYNILAFRSGRKAGFLSRKHVRWLVGDSCMIGSSCWVDVAVLSPHRRRGPFAPAWARQQAPSMTYDKVTLMMLEMSEANFLHAYSCHEVVGWLVGCRLVGV